MELEHFSHHHPLILNTEQDHDGEQITCSGCEEPIWSSTYYSCSSCHFFLHTKCSLLPLEINSHLHREHTLTLLAKPPYYYTSCICVLCGKTCSSFIYHCSICKFDLDIKCAFPLSLSVSDLRDKKMIREHFSHQHLLILNKDKKNDGQDVTCFGCKEAIFGPSYSCIATCQFILHKKCAELPREIKIHLHPQHSLILLAKPPPYCKTCVCDLCGKTCRSFVYHCSHCNFDIDVNCAIPPCIFEDNLMRKKHFSHQHPLVFNEEQQNDGELITCFGCEKRISCPSYSCTPCKFALHKKCAELPRQIKSHFHREHSLTLLAEPPPHYTRCVCNLCGKNCRSFVYHCSLCNFDLDIKCAFPPCIFEPESQRHQFICLLKSISFTCNACGTDGDNSPFLCITCQFMVHKKCLSIPRTINTPLHQHPIDNNYFLQEDASRNNNCGICQNEVNADYGSYNCQDCNFIAHVNCAKGNTVRTTVQDSKPSIALNGDSINSTKLIVQEIKRGQKNTVPEIRHFSHQHSLVLIEEAKHDKCCDGCMLPISTPCYGCAECNFFLDLSCLELPKQKQFLNGGMPLILHTKESTVDGVYHCSACYQYGNGFTYKCGEINLTFDVRCSNLVSSSSFNHEGHEHPLYFTTGTKGLQCSACNDSGWPFLFSCSVCNFNLDFRCATLPNKAGHRYDKHPLFLTCHSVDDGSNEICCEICEHDIAQKLWFYYCAECKFSAHPKCILGKNPFVKLGGNYTFDIHPHPVTLVQKRRRFPSCHTCSMPCDDLALECTVSQCNFIIHRKKEYCVFPASKKPN